MAIIEPKLYRKYVTYNKKGNAMIYVQMPKALYGSLESVLRFYKKLVKDLKGYGFEVNQYNSCVANKMINGK